MTRLLNPPRMEFKDLSAKSAEDGRLMKPWDMHRV